jgi:hypothetical protein
MALLALGYNTAFSQLAAVSCTPTFSYGPMYFTNITVGSLSTSYTAAGASYTGTGTNSSIVASTIPGGTITFSATGGNYFGTMYTGYTQVFVDYNNNGTFTDAGEFINVWYNGYTASGSFVVPTTVTPGAKRMRFKFEYSTYTYAQPCAVYNDPYGWYGDFRDITLNIGYNNDASIPSVATSTAAPFPAGANNIIAVLNNNGLNNLTSCTVNWTVNGIAQAPISWTGSLTPGQSTNVTLASGYNFPAVGAITVQATSASPNGVTDGNTTNDASLPVLMGAALSGTYNVGPGNPLASPMDAANQLSAGGTLGSVTFNIADGVYTGNVYVGNVPGNQSTRPIVFQSASGNRNSCVIQFSGITTPAPNTGILRNSTSIGGTPTLRVNNTHWVTFQNLTFASLNSAYNNCVEICGLGATVTAPATQTYSGSNNVTFNSCVFNGQAGSTLATMADVLFVTGVNGTINNNLTVTNSVFNGGACQMYASRTFISVGGIFFTITPSAPPIPMTAWQITNNTFNNCGAFPLRISNTADLQFTGNTITSTIPVSQRGIMFTENEGVFSFSKNRVTLPVASGLEAIFMGTRTANSTRALVSNNYINVSGAGWAINNSIGSNIDYMHNTVYHSGNGTVFQSTSASGLSIVNNIFYGQGGGAAVNLPSGFGTSNYNDYFTTGTTLEMLNSSPYSTLSAWQSATGQDAASSSASVTFISPTTNDLALTTVDARLYGIGSQSNATVNSNIRGRVPDDIMGTSRNRSEVYMGAFQLVPVISFNPPPPAMFEGCQNQTVVMNANANVTAGAAMTFTWQRNGSPLIDGVNGVSGSRTPVLTITGAQPSLNGGDYVLNVSATGGATPIVSNIISVIINAPIEIVRNPESRMMCLGNETALSVIANGTIKGYQWQKDGLNINGATSPILVIQNADYNASGRYRCVMTGTCGTNFINTKDATIFVANSTIVGRDPESMGVALGSTGYLNVEVAATAQAPGYSPQFQWYKGSTMIKDDSRISGATTSQLTVRNLRAGDMGKDYTCVVTGLCGSQTSQPGGFYQSSLTITNQPQDAEVCSDGEATLSVGVTSNISGASYTYKWMKDGVPVNNSASVTGSSTRTLRITNLKSGDAGSYTVLITATGGSNIISNSATLTVLDKPAVTTQPANVTICEGLPASMSVTATGGGLRYVWQIDGVDFSAATTSTISVPAVPAMYNGAKVTCIVTNNCGNITSEAGVLTVNIKPLITEQPNSVGANFGGKLVLSVKANKANTYQWTHKGQDIPGATTSTYEVRNATLADEGAYMVKITNDCGTTESGVANVKVGPTSVETESMLAGYSISSVSPMPTNDVATVSFTTPSVQQVRISLVDLVGNEITEVFNGMSNENSTTINANFNIISSGSYTLILRSGQYMVSKQIVIVR